jgi:predicted TIM-barrel fold metal-dependent hydrolase
MKYFFILVLLSFQLAACSQVGPSMDFEKYEPKSTLVVPGHKLTHAKFPFIDIHNHQWEMDGQNLAGLIKDMDSLNMGVMNNLSGRSYKDRGGFFDIQDTNYLKKEMNNIRSHYPSRFTIFTNISFWKFGEPGWAKNAVHELETDVKNGASGLKIYKDLGMEFKDEKGKRIAVDDARLDPVWDKCGELKIPVLIHSADPASFWDKEDEHNERWLELKTHPDRKKENGNPASWAQIIREQHNLFRKHPNTIFIAAHMGWLGNNLTELGKLLDSLPNVYVEIAAVIAELGRQPRAAKQFFIKYQDRILFGKDSWVPSEYQTYFRVLETEDEYFPYHKKYHAFWPMYGMGLPDEILKKVYYKNAIKILPRIDKTLFPD